MQNKELREKYRIGLAGVFFVALSLAFFALVFAVVSHRNLQDTYELAQETAAFLEASCEKYDNYENGAKANALQDLLDASKCIATFLPESEVAVDDELLSEIVRAQHMSGIIVVDAQGALVAQAGLAHDGSAFDQWADVLSRQVIRDISLHPNKTYSSIITLDGVEFEYVVSAYGENLMLCYESTATPDSDPYNYCIDDILPNNTFHKDPIAIISDDERVLSTNADQLAGKTRDELPLLSNDVQWERDELTPITLNGSTWYAYRSAYKDYRFFVVYSADQVFSDRGYVVAMAGTAYLVLCVAVLVVRGYLARRNLRATQKQLRIINAISATFDTTFLLHLDTLNMEPIRMSESVTRLFSEHPEAHDFLEHVCRDIIAPEYREAVMELMDVATFDKRMAGNAFIGVDVKVADGTWYSLQVMPQLRDGQGKLQAVLVASRNVTAMKRAEELSYRDKLTGLRNRNYLESRGEEFMRAGDLPVSVIMADCNYLKRTNDTLGHEWGDKLLVRVAHALVQAAGQDVLVMRIGGDEFLLVCPRMGDVEAEQLVARAKEALAAASDEDLTLSVSFGVATVCADEATFAEAFKAADEAMYAEKQAVHARQ